MKKILVSLLSAMVCLASAFSANYHHSVGGTVGTDYGFRYKGFFGGTSGLGIQADLMVRISNMGKNWTNHSRYNGNTTTTKVKNGWNMAYWTFEASPDIFYQGAIKSWGWGSIDWFAGGGMSLGMMKTLDWGSVVRDVFGSYGYDYDYDWDYGEYQDGYRDKVNGKFGVNAMLGVEISFAKIPLAVSTEFRPGYGLLFGTNKIGNATQVNWMSFFDWGLSASVRYCF